MEMAKAINKINITGSVNFGTTIRPIVIIGDTENDSVFLIKNIQNEEVLKITKEGEIYYRENNELKKAECSEHVGHAFIQTVLHITTQDYETAILDWYTKKIASKENGDEFLNKLEKLIRKRKLEKLKR